MTESYKNSANFLSTLDPAQTAQDAHNVDEHAYDVIIANQFVPKRYSKIDLTYTTLTNGDVEIEYVTYYGDGIKEISKIRCRETPAGSAELTSYDFSNSSAAALSGRYLILYDNAGSVGVWFDVDNTSTPPTTGAARDLEVDISTGDLPTVMAQKFSAVVNADSEFIASFVINVAAIASVDVGNKTNATNGDTGLPVNSVDGVDTLNNKYFYLYSANDETKYYVWYNVDSGGSDPDPDAGGSTGIEVGILGTDDPTNITLKTAAEINNVSDFSAEADNEYIVITNNFFGPSTDTADVNTEHLCFVTSTQGVTHQVVGKLFLVYNQTTGCLISVEKII